MDRAGYLVEAHVREGRPVAELARAHGVHPSWIYRLLARYRSEGDAGLIPRSRRPRTSPNALGGELEEEIVLLRKQLTEEGLDAGAQTIHWHLEATPRPGAVAEHDHASIASPWLRSPSAPEAPQVVVRAFRSWAPERVLAVGYDALEPH